MFLFTSRTRSVLHRQGVELIVTNLRNFTILRGMLSSFFRLLAVGVLPKQSQRYFATMRA